MIYRSIDPCNIISYSLNMLTDPNKSLIYPLNKPTDPNNCLIYPLNMPIDPHSRPSGANYSLKCPLNT